MYSVGAPHTWPQALVALMWLIDNVKVRRKQHFPIEISGPILYTTRLMCKIDANCNKKKNNKKNQLIEHTSQNSLKTVFLYLDLCVFVSDLLEFK